MPDDAEVKPLRRMFVVDLGYEEPEPEAETEACLQNAVSDLTEDFTITRIAKYNTLSPLCEEMLAALQDVADHCDGWRIFHEEPLGIPNLPPILEAKLKQVAERAEAALKLEAGDKK